jgi:hypothetical protein
MPGGHRPSHKQEQFIAELLTEPTLAKAAAKAGISQRTARNWMKQPDFTAAYRAARSRIVDDALTHLQRATGQAVETLRKLLSCKQSSTRARAALGILDHARRAVEMGDLQQQVAELRQKLEDLSREQQRKHRA